MVDEDDYHFTPPLLRDAANGFVALWRNSIQKDARDVLGAERTNRAFCLLFAVELYMKAFLVSRRKRFARTETLKGLSHNLGRIFCEITKIETGPVVESLRQALEQCNLFEATFIDLRYPESGRLVEFEDSIHTENHPFVRSFELINEEIVKWNKATWK